MFVAHCGQHPKRLLILRLQSFARTLGVCQRGRAHRTDANLKAIMFHHAARRPRKGVFAPKVRQHTVQPPRPSAVCHSQALGQGTQIVLVLVAPNPITHTYQPKDTPPRQRFFLRLRTVASWPLSSSATRASACVAKSFMLVLPNARNSSMSSASISSTVFNGPSALPVSSRMLWKRAHSLGCWRSRWMNCFSPGLNS